MTNKQRQIIDWYRDGVINRRTFVYWWQRERCTLAINAGPVVSVRIVQ